MASQVILVKIAATLCRKYRYSAFCSSGGSIAWRSQGDGESRDVMLFISYSGGAKNSTSSSRVWKINPSRCWR
ncbi:hypothetical protein KCP70_05345 [Salmonella enterica subsp. enterica]|nr:hypothetical protein KCP70_05345 [Salmonella enterica subsp. enterica]